MEQKIIDIANKYKELTLMLEDFALEEPIDDNVTEEVQAALVKLYYTKAFEAEIEKCEDLLEEDTDEETVNAVYEAAGIIDVASEASFSVVDEFCSHDKGFAKQIEGITASTETEDLFENLIKLYRCEAIISCAYKCSMKIPKAVNRNLSAFQPEQDVTPMDAEEEINNKFGIDMYELVELRQNLLDKIGSLIKGNNML